MSSIYAKTSDRETTGSSENRFKPRIELTGKLGYSSKKGGSRNIGRLGFVLPVFQKMNSLLFLSVIGMSDTSRHLEGNFGFGYRMLINPAWIIGGYGFYDIRKTQNNNYLNQATLGLEALSKNLEFRLNTYIPFGKSYELDSHHIYRVNYDVNTQIANINIRNRRISEKALAGFDIEAGGGIPKFTRLELFGGYYHFFGKNVQSVKGFRVRGNINVTDWLTVELETNYDKSRKITSYGGLRFGWNIGSSKSSEQNWIDKKMVQLPVRDVDIISAEEDLQFTKIDKDVSIVSGMGAIKLSDFDESRDKLIVNDEATQNLYIVSNQKDLDDLINSGIISQYDVIELYRDKITLAQKLMPDLQQNEQQNVDVEDDILLEPQQNEQQNVDVEDDILPEPQQNEQQNVDVEDDILLEPQQNEQQNVDVEDDILLEPQQNEQQNVNVEDDPLLEQQQQNEQQNVDIENDPPPGLVQNEQQNVDIEDDPPPGLAQNEQQNVDIEDDILVEQQQNEQQNVNVEDDIPIGMKRGWVVDDEGRYVQGFVPIAGNRDNAPRRNRNNFNVEQEPENIIQDRRRFLAGNDDEEDDPPQLTGAATAAEVIRQARQQREEAARLAREDARARGVELPPGQEPRENIKRRLEQVFAGPPPPQVGDQQQQNLQNQRPNVAAANAQYSWENAIRPNMPERLKNMRRRSVIATTETEELERYMQNNNADNNPTYVLVQNQLNERRVNQQAAIQEENERIRRLYDQPNTDMRQLQRRLRTGQIPENDRAAVRELTNERLQNQPQNNRGRGGLLAGIRGGIQLRNINDNPPPVRPIQRQAPIVNQLGNNPVQQANNAGGNMAEQALRAFRQRGDRRQNIENMDFARQLMNRTISFEQIEDANHAADFPGIMNIIRQNYSEHNNFQQIINNYNNYEEENRWDDE